ncbi:Retrovirus-related Pol polyprotein from transposon RE2 [Sesamum angolense]|uniref:Retrovirus-related Pol polyprotein from transposon RE2 n=1 Tax=Sesamum angolense TaxID=2727404 RepID=A0AAE1X8C0_9LAMI|nr:Retrovirus-related Pol polyprotein from transposon RE2 [Sesamum angolense]
MAHVTLNERVYTVTLSCEEYEQLLHRPAAPSATPSSPGTFIASHGESWMIDSGATSHLTVRPTDYLTLTNVLFAPKFPVNLLSVNQLTKTHNCSVTFYPSYCVIQDLQTRRTIGTGHERGGLYFLDTTPPVDARALSASVSPLQWHSRLGHPSLPTLQKILPIDSARLECESCELGKHHRASFPPRVEKRSSSPFTLVHSDIWGPCRFESLRGFRYFITFIDDYSRMTWVYLLKDRSQVPTIITSFYNEIYTQFSVNIRILRTDNALEFVQKSVSDFCNSKGILHQTSCPYTSQQNGVAERKHRHLLDVARTIMTHMHVPKSYWGDAVLTACYLINRMPSTVLHGDTPYSCIFPDQPLFGIAPRVFGCYFLRIHFFLLPQSPVVIPPPSVPLPAPTLSVPPHTEPPTRPLQVYSRRNRSTTTTLIVPPDLPPTAAPGNLLPHQPMISLLLFGKALRHPTWKMAMDDEMSALVSRGTWELVEVPPNADIVACRWVFTLKFRADGTLERYKARLVAKGFTQTYGVDYFETFSPVARLNSIRVLFSLAVNLSWPMYQMDIKNAFLYGDLNETVYMEQPPGYVAQGEKQRMVCKLKKAIYGLKQSPRAWFDKFSRIIGEFGFSRCQADHSVFVQTTTSGMVVLAVYVDDILITGSDLVGIEEAKTYLQKHFITKDLGRPRYFLGLKSLIANMESLYLRENMRVTSFTKQAYSALNQWTLLWILIRIFGMTTFMDKPRLVHWEAALRILKYIKASPGKGLLFKRHGHVKIEAYSDADYAGAKDDRKSTSGYCTYVGGNLVTWRSKKNKLQLLGQVLRLSIELWLTPLVKSYG